MRYWDDMFNKFGFNDGEAVPPDAETCRQVYVQVVNKIAADLGSEWHVEPYDRAGVHNWCMIFYVPNGSTIDDVNGSESPDDRLHTAIEMAHEAGLDIFVETDTEVLRGPLERLLGVTFTDDTEMYGLAETADPAPTGPLTEITGVTLAFTVHDKELLLAEAKRAIEQYGAGHEFDPDNLGDCIVELLLHSNPGVRAYLDYGVELVKQATWSSRAEL